MNAAVQLRITDVRLMQLKVVKHVGNLEPAWDKGGSTAYNIGGGTITQIDTDAGISGIGPGCPPDLLPAVRNVLLGEDPFDTEALEAKLRYYTIGGGHYRNTAGVDIALWDIVGKACGQPLYKLWGGGRDKAPAYASMVQLSTLEERVELARRLADEGWQAMKLRIHFETMQEDIVLVEAVCDAVDGRMEIMVDANQAQSSGTWQPGVLWDYRRALETAKALDQLGCYWFEEPLPRYAFEQLTAINSQVAMPLAGGENNPYLHEFQQMAEQNVYDVLQPESLVLGGITTLRKVGVLAEMHGKLVEPHHGGRGLGTIAHLHLTASWPHSPFLEVLHDPPIAHYSHGFAFLTEPPVVDEQGYVKVPQRPGLGVEIDPDFIEGEIRID